MIINERIHCVRLLYNVMTKMQKGTVTCILAHSYNSIFLLVIIILISENALQLFPWN